MHELISYLEPNREEKHTILINELDEFNQVEFVHKGKIVVGYELNKQKIYCLQFNNKCPIGGYGCTFNKRASFIYTSLTEIESLFIRKLNWKSLIQDHPIISA